MNHTIREHRYLRLVHDRADPLGNLLDEIERDECQVRRPVPTRIAVLVYAIGLACFLCLVMGMQL